MHEQNDRLHPTSSKQNKQSGHILCYWLFHSFVTFLHVKFVKELVALDQMKVAELTSIFSSSFMKGNVLVTSCLLLWTKQSFQSEIYH